MIIEATAPTRIDLAGAAFDIYPLYIFEDGGVTVNIAIDLINTVKLEARNDREIHLHSLDLNIKEHAADADSLDLEDKLGFIARIVKFYRPKIGLNITTHNTIPKGSGLGTSSSLLIALSGALNELNDTKIPPQLLIDYGACIEAQSITVPTGKQDYFAALYGGISAVWSQIKGCWREEIPLDDELKNELETRFILTFTGKPHFSGATNWDLVKGYIDNVGNIRESLQRGEKTGLKMRECFMNRDLQRLPELLNEEWENRKGQAEGVTTPKIDEMIEAAKKNGALTSKLCGAGGGGCMITYTEPDNRKKVINALQAHGAKLMEFKIARQGLKIRRI